MIASSRSTNLFKGQTITLQNTMTDRLSSVAASANWLGGAIPVPVAVADAVPVADADAVTALPAVTAALPAVAAASCGWSLVATSSALPGGTQMDVGPQGWLGVPPGYRGVSGPASCSPSATQKDGKGKISSTLTGGTGGGACAAAGESGRQAHRNAGRQTREARPQIFRGSR